PRSVPSRARAAAGKLARAVGETLGGEQRGAGGGGCGEREQEQAALDPARTCHRGRSQGPSPSGRGGLGNVSPGCQVIGSISPSLERNDPPAARLAASRVAR